MSVTSLFLWGQRSDISRLTGLYVSLQDACVVALDRVHIMEFRRINKDISGLSKITGTALLPSNAQYLALRTKIVLKYCSIKIT